MSKQLFDTDVLIIGAGPTGTTLAAALLRHGVDVQVLEKAPQHFTGSRAKGIQPRTQEIFEDLGILKEAHKLGSTYPKLGIHFGPLTIPFTMHKKQTKTPDIPYPNSLLLPQYETDALLHRLVRQLGGSILFNKTLDYYTQDQYGVTAYLSTGEEIHAKFLVGADGGASVVRKTSTIPFIGETNEADKMVLIDGTVHRLKRHRWHIWPRRKGKQIVACPLPSSSQFQIMIRLTPHEEIDLSEQALSDLFFELTGLTLENITWKSLFRPNIRLATNYRQNKVFIAGDAAHVHTPAGAQGLNTGIQDAYNLAWKLAQVLHGASDTLLDSYELERRPVAANVLKLSTKLYAGIEKNKLASLKRGDEERQLGISYFNGPLAPSTNSTTQCLKTGDRAPDAFCILNGKKTRLFELLHGVHFTLLVFGERAAASLRGLKMQLAHSEVKQYIVNSLNLIDCEQQLHHHYGIVENTWILIRPDGYIGAILTEDFEKNWQTVVTRFSL